MILLGLRGHISKIFLIVPQGALSIESAMPMVQRAMVPVKEAPRMRECYIREPHRVYKFSGPHDDLYIEELPASLATEVYKEYTLLMRQSASPDGHDILYILFA